MIKHCLVHSIKNLESKYKESKWFILNLQIVIKVFAYPIDFYQVLI